MKRSKESKARCCTLCLCQKELLLPCGTVTYQLLECNARYFVKCLLGKDCAVVPLGSSIGTAVHLFEALVAGAVTPCTAADVVEDLCYDLL